MRAIFCQDHILLLCSSRREALQQTDILSRLLSRLGFLINRKTIRPDSLSKFHLSGLGLGFSINGSIPTPRQGGRPSQLGREAAESVQTNIQTDSTIPWQSELHVHRSPTGSDPMPRPSGAEGACEPFQEGCTNSRGKGLPSVVADIKSVIIPNLVLRTNHDSDNRRFVLVMGSHPGKSLHSRRVAPPLAGTTPSPHKRA